MSHGAYSAIHIHGALPRTRARVPRAASAAAAAQRAQQRLQRPAAVGRSSLVLHLGQRLLRARQLIRERALLLRQKLRSSLLRASLLRRRGRAARERVSAQLGRCTAPSCAPAAPRWRTVPLSSVKPREKDTKSCSSVASSALASRSAAPSSARTSSASSSRSRGRVTASGGAGPQLLSVSVKSDQRRPRRSAAALSSGMYAASTVGARVYSTAPP
jgi:hypothetical protein